MRSELGFLWRIAVIVVLIPAGTTAHGTMKVFYSDGVIQAGDEYDRVEVHDTPPFHTTVDMTGGTVGTLSDRNTGILTHDASTVNISGGIVEFLETYDSSTVNVSGGYVGDWCGCTGLGLYDSSTLNVYGGGTLFGGSFNVLELTGSSKLNVYGGDLILLVMARDFSTVNVQDGYVYGGIELHEYTTINMYGGGIDLWSGFLGNIDVPETAAVNIYGRDFVYEPQGQWRYYIDDPDNGLWTSRLTGLGFDGTPITYLGLPEPATHSNINLIPEPSTFLLCSLGGLWLVRKRKTTRIVGREGGWEMRPIFAVRWVFVLVILLPCSGARVYATTIAFYSDGVIQKGDKYDKVDVYDTPPAHTTVDMTGGHVYDPGMFTYNSSTANILGGTVEALNAYGSSTVNIGGGGVGGRGESLRAHDWSTINISGGFVGLELSSTQVVLYDSSVMNIEMSDGFIGALIYALDSSSVSIYKGNIGHVNIRDASTVNIYGGEIGDRWGFFIMPSASAKIYGSGFIYDPEWRWCEDDAVLGNEMGQSIYWDRARWRAY